MDSSSDGSFAWTDASEDTTDNETMAKTSINTSNSGEESESGKTYKKKLQQRLFSGSAEDDADNSVARQPRKRKLSQKHSDEEHVGNHKKKRIKTEPETDVDTKQVKKKLKSSDIKGPDLANGSYEDTYLDLKVKSEQSFVVPSPVKLKISKRKKVSSVTDTTESNGDLTECHKSPTSFEVKAGHASDSQTHFEDTSISLDEDKNECDFNKMKKKKNKSKRKRDNSESVESIKDSSIKENYCTNESAIEQSIDSNQNNDSSDEMDNNATTDAHNKTISKGEQQIANGDISKSQISDHSISEKNSNRKSRISDRIKFEDEDDSNVLTKKPKTAIKKTRNKSILTNFVESSFNLRPFCAKIPNTLAVTDDDDVWAIKCPKDINVEAFQDKKWALDSKCKIKLEGQTYEGDIDDRARNMTIVSAENQTTLIKNFALNGYVRLHRRIPKAHIQEENIMISNQNNFIPLPETKTRHPLFGLNYKKAIKIPSAVAERLRMPELITSSDKRKKKDQRKLQSNKKADSTKPNTEPAPKPPAALEYATSSSKKKKRKHSKTTDELDAPRRQKRIKHDPESAEAWESERAIEENLFNF